MKSLIKPVFLMLILMFFLPLSGLAASGKIIDIFGEGIVTVQLTGELRVEVGERVDLTYMAGSLPMAIGRYQVTTAQKDILLAKPVALNMPASSGMKVQIEVVKDGGAVAVTKSRPKPSVVAGKSSAAADKELEGRVDAVSGDEINIEMKGAERPQIGWSADLFYVTRQGKELPVGTWKVGAVAGSSVKAVKVKGVGDARVGLKAVLSSKPKVEAGPVAAKPEAPVPALVKKAPQKLPPKTPVSLLGQQAPVKAPPKKTVAGKPQLPPGVKKRPAVKEKKEAVVQNPETKQFIAMLKSGNLNSQRDAAKRISRKRGLDAAVYAAVSDLLLGQYRSSRTNMEIDTMSWLCKALASSGNSKYKETLTEVYRNTRNRKLKGYAKKSLALL